MMRASLSDHIRLSAKSLRFFISYFGRGFPIARSAGTLALVAGMIAARGTRRKPVQIRQPLQWHCIFGTITVPLGRYSYS